MGRKSTTAVLEAPAPDPRMGRRRRPDQFDADVRLGLKLRELRIMRGLSQELLAKALDISFQQVQKYEKGVNRVSATRLYEIAQALGVGIEVFFDEIADVTREPPVLQAAAHVSPAAVRAFSALDSNDRKTVLYLMRHLAKVRAEG